MILTLQSKLIVLETQMREFKFITQFALDESTRTFNKFQILSEFIATMDGNTLEISIFLKNDVMYLLLFCEFLN